MVLAAFALIMTVVFRKLQTTTASAPKWIFSSISLLGNYRLLQFLVTSNQELKELRESGAETEDNMESVQSIESEFDKKQVWSSFANFLEWMSLFSIFLTYIILLATLIPK